MKLFYKFSLATLIAVSLVACDKKQDYVSDNSITTDKKPEQIFDYPVATSEFSDPIVIAKEKSETGLADLQKFVYYFSGVEVQIDERIELLTQKLRIEMQSNPNQISAELNQELADFSTFLNQVKANVQALDLKDNEVKQFAHRTLLNAEISKDALVASANNFEKIMKLSLKSEEVKKYFDEQTEKTTKLREAINANKQALQNAGNELINKYSN